MCLMYKISPEFEPTFFEFASPGSGWFQYWKIARNLYYQKKKKSEKKNVYLQQPIPLPDYFEMCHMAITC